MKITPEEACIINDLFVKLGVDFNSKNILIMLPTMADIRHGNKLEYLVSYIAKNYSLTIFPSRVILQEVINTNIEAIEDRNSRLYGIKALKEAFRGNLGLKDCKKVMDDFNDKFNLIESV